MTIEASIPEARLTDAEVETILKAVLCSGINKPGTPAWRMVQDYWKRARAAEIR